ncbi:tRNA 5-methoxyuridine(34)/uridine 5-oxyacetic acid(34) synthase CmoB [Helicobacter monodelphidis]|nr:tRNA 5-methoxyuridine(34)/uridine 5-oxyacetic acid(34) synthase CmoB [Helicobacter sp. 15-1451]
MNNKILKPLLQCIESLQTPCFSLDSQLLSRGIVGFEAEISTEIYTIAQQLKPWRKGPFYIGNFFIDSEWVSSKKFDILKPYLQLNGKRIGDIGCNNGYYLYRMLEFSPRELVGFDPSFLAYLQFLLMNRFLQSPIVFELLGVEHLPLYTPPYFDILFCLGVLYHRSDPIQTLKILKNALTPGGELFLDTLMIEGHHEVALFPKERYARMKNVYFIPTQKTLENWLYRAGFKEIQCLDIVKTTIEEQRVSCWSSEQSLGDFLDSSGQFSIEGYPAPQRIYVYAKI